jgi:hypothetical protein
MPGAILRFTTIATGPLLRERGRQRGVKLVDVFAVDFLDDMPWPASVRATSKPGMYCFGWPEIVTLLSSMITLTLSRFDTHSRAASASSPSICAPSSRA